MHKLEEELYRLSKEEDYNENLLVEIEGSELLKLLDAYNVMYNDLITKLTAVDYLNCKVVDKIQEIILEVIDKIGEAIELVDGTTVIEY